MFIKTIVKTDKKSGKRYDYYRLCESYRIEGKPRHRTILSLGLLDELKSKEERKLLADRIEDMIKGFNKLFISDQQPHIEKYAKVFYSKIVNQKLLDVKTTAVACEQEKEITDFQNIDINTLTTEQAKDIGSEWLTYQTIKQLKIGSMLENLGFDDRQVKTAMAHIISRCVYPASEHKTALWINENSGLLELPGFENLRINKNHLYNISRKLFSKKEEIEQFLSHKTNELFDLEDTVILYDLTNTYFEGIKQDSKYAKFGRSKEKRSDARLISLALVINVFGFVKYSKIYSGNISDGSTLEQTINDIEAGMPAGSTGKPVIAMDAGFSSDANIKMLKDKGYDYVSVRKSKLKEYQLEKAEDKQVVMLDKRKNKIKLSRVITQNDETILYVKSDKKADKENSMTDKLSERFEQGMEEIKLSLTKHRGTKKADKVHERIGRLKEKYSSVHSQYAIVPKAENNIVTGLTWTKTKEKKAFSGIYFIRTSLSDTETNIFKIYNILTEVESSFRTLKTDLSLRPVFHQTDDNVLAHINLGVLAYQIVATIRYQLKQQNITHDWRNIVRIMNTQKTVTNSMKNKKGEKIIVRTCSVPSVKAKEIYDALNFKPAPFYRLKAVLPEL